VNDHLDSHLLPVEGIACSVRTAVFLWLIQLALPSEQKLHQQFAKTNLVHFSLSEQSFFFTPEPAAESGFDKATRWLVPA
jgi:hypothetical protein